ncbi:MAG: transglycosylase domain-containing protein, partial [Collinsella intestinalis]
MGPRQRHARSRAKTHATPVVLFSVLGFLLVAGIAFGIGMLGNINRWLSDLPDYTDADEYLVSEPTHILDSQGTEIATFFVQNRESVTADKVSEWVLKGTVDVEDERFYEHNGVDIIGIGRAVLAQLSGRSEGASTITQQLVRNTILSEEQFDQTIERKVREAFIAMEMEKIFSKDEILMMYLNTIYYGHGAYGIQAASKTYLSKNASELTLAEAALLIGLPNSPSYYDPTVNPDVAVDRRNKVLGNMLRIGTISQDEYDAAVAEPLALNVTETSDTGISVYAHPYFVDYVKSLLQEEFSTDVLFKGGLTVTTTIDPAIQQAAETAAVENINKYPAANDLQIGMSVVDPKTGHIKAMVGGRDYNADPNHVNHATAKRQPGSSFKSFTLATAIKMGVNPNITINCESPMYWDNPGGEDIKIQNIGNHNYGYRSLASATAVSSNTGYVQLAETIGNQNILQTCKSLGLDTSSMHDVLSMTLGTGDVTTLQMANAYASFANGGEHRAPVAITEIKSRTGEVMYTHKDEKTQALTAGDAAAVTEVLETVMERGGTGVTGNPWIKQPIA